MTPPIKTGILYGILLSILTIGLHFIYTSIAENPYQPNWVSSLIWLSFLIIVPTIAYRRYCAKFQPVPFSDLMIIAVCISLTVALSAGVENYVLATYLEPNLLEKLMILAEENWANQGYSEEVIAGQAEHYMYASASNWALVGVQFVFIITFIIATGMAFMTKLITRINNVHGD